jgi:glyoxylase-like metal-dependent hydrolase (beta-lactamase superfamily II)
MIGRILIALPLLSIDTAPSAALLHLSDFGLQVPLSGYAWLYRDSPQSKWTLIDTGTESLEAPNAGRPPERRWKARSLVAELARHGVAIKDIGDVILTHLHHDHCGSIEQMPAARWHVPRIEWEFVNDPANADVVPEPVFPRALFPRMAKHGVVLMSDGDQPVPGLRMLHLGGHTPGLMAVEIYDQAGKLQVVLGGDVMPLYENLSRGIPPGTLWHWGQCKRALERLSTYTVPVLPSHDVKLMEKYPSGVILHD